MNPDDNESCYLLSDQYYKMYDNIHIIILECSK